MKLGTVITTSFFISFILIIVGALLKITHSGCAETWLMMSILASLVFIGTATYEVWTSTHITHSEKITWTLAFIFFSSIAGLIYILDDRKRITSNL